MFKAGDTVTIRFTTLTGVIKDAEVDKATLTLQYLVEYTDRYGEVQQRYFAADDIAAA